jgi:hypothetical protein
MQSIASGCVLGWRAARCGTIAVLMSCAAVAAAETATADAPVATVEVPAPAAAPPTMYFGSVAGDELLTLLRAQPRFAQVSKDLVGSPIAIQVSQSFEPTAGGTASAFASALLTGGTLGLIPMVTNNDLVITWEIVVNGTVLSRYRYRNNFTRVDSIYAGGSDTTYGLGKEGLAWVRSTTQSFMDDVAKDEKVAALVAEHAFYFGPPANGAAAR